MNFFGELKRRNVFRVGIAYVVVAWLVLQVADVVINNIGAPVWVFQVIMMVLALGFPLVLVFAWAFEMTPEGLKKEKDVDRSQSITGKTGRKLDFTIIGVLILVAAYFVWESRFQVDETSAISTAVVPANAGIQLPSTNEERAQQNSIAVLPFANRSNVDDDLFFTDGIHDDLLTQLAKISGLKVISRTSVMEYRETTKKIPEIARELGVSKILEGGVQRAGKRIRINAQLIDVTTDQHLWAETFDREMTIENLFDIQSEITRHIVAAVKLELTETQQRSLARVPTSNLQAYENYLQARALVNRPDYAQIHYIEAQPWAERAVQLDPEFAQAWALLTTIHGMAVWIGYDNNPKRKQAARHALDMAISYAPDQPTTLAAQAEYFYRIENDFSKSLKAFEAAHQALPGDVRILESMAMAQRRTGHWQEAIESLENVIQLDPANSSAPTLMVSTLAMMRQWKRVSTLVGPWILRFPDASDMQVVQAESRVYQYGDLSGARALLNKMLPKVSEAYADFATSLPLLERDYQAAISIWDQPAISSISSNRGWLGWQDMNIGIAYQLLGDTEKSRAHFLQTIDVIEAAKPTGTSSDTGELTVVAIAYALLGEHQKALATMREVTAFMPEEKDRINGTYLATINAYVLALAGDREQALIEIERLLDKPSGFRRWDLYLNPQWDFFRDDERFNDLIRPLNVDEVGQ